MSTCRYCGNETGTTYTVCGAYACNDQENKEDVATNDEPALKTRVRIDFDKGAEVYQLNKQGNDVQVFVDLGDGDTMQFKFTDEGLITDVINDRGEVIGTSGRMYDEIADDLVEGGNHA